MSDPITDAQAKINLAMALLQEAQQLLNGGTQDSAPQPAASAHIESPTAERQQSTSARASSKQEAIEALFAAALMTYDSDDSLTEQLKLVMHSTIANNKHALASLVRFNWTRLSAQKNHYLEKPNDPSSFTVNREQPVPNQPAATIKVFLDAPNRNPTPCTLMQEADGSWRVLTFSL